MLYRKLGNTGLSVSVLGFGAMRLPMEGESNNITDSYDPNKPIDEKEAIRMIEYAVANGVIGLEWVLLGDRNIRDKKAVVAFARALGCALLPSKMNGVKFLRYEGPDLVKLGRAIVTDFYSFGPTEKVELLAEGFSWP